MRPEIKPLGKQLPTAVAGRQQEKQPLEDWTSKGGAGHQEQKQAPVLAAVGAAGTRSSSRHQEQHQGHYCASQQRCINACSQGRWKQRQAVH